MDPTYPSLAAFAADWSERQDAGPVAYAHPVGPPALPPGAVRDRLEEVLDTVVALQRADWLQEGVYVGPRALGSVYRDLLHCARTLQIPVPPAIVSACPSSQMGAFGTDERAWLHLSSLFFTNAATGERRFVAGRLAGHLHARQVTWGTLYALLVDHDGLRKVARRNLGPTLDIVLAPLSLGARLALSRWHRAAAVTADRAGLLCAGDLDAAGRALLRTALGVRPDVSVEDYLEQRTVAGAQVNPARWTELLAGRPWMHKRMKALELFARSEVWVELGGQPLPGNVLERADLDRRTDALLGVR